MISKKCSTVRVMLKGVVEDSHMYIQYLAVPCAV